MKDREERDPVDGWRGASLDPRVRDALNHRLRREILRELNAGECPRPAAEIVEALVPASPADVNYHLQVLCLRNVVEGQGPTIGGRHLTYKAVLGEDADVVSALRTTEEWDHEQREEAKKAHSSRFLSMFRIPKPTRTIRLGSHRKPRPEPES